MPAPLTLRPEEAAQLVGCVDDDGKPRVDQFRREVKRGIWPQPLIKDSRPQRWSRVELERKLLGNASENDPALRRLEKNLGVA